MVYKYDDTNNVSANANKIANKNARKSEKELVRLTFVFTLVSRVNIANPVAITDGSKRRMHRFFVFK